MVPTTWLADQAVHHRAAVQGVVGTVSVDWQQHSATTRRRYDRLYCVRDPGVHGHVHGANLGVRADAYWRVGGFRPLHVGEDVDLVGRLVEAGTPLAWDAYNAVRTSDRSDCRARGGFGDYVRSLADDPSMLLPKRLAHDVRRERARRGLPSTNSGYAHPTCIRRSQRSL